MNRGLVELKVRTLPLLQASDNLREQFITIAKEKSPSASFKLARRLAIQLSKSQVEALGLAKASRWLAVIRRDKEQAFQQACEELRFTAILQGLNEGDATWLRDVVSFADKIHEGQVRGASGELAICHLLRVGRMAVDEFQKDPSLGKEFMAAGILHDSLEDTNVYFEELAHRFGSEVAQLVAALTHEYEEEPEEINLGRVASGGRKAILLKRIDKIDNVSHLGDTSSEFRAKKLAELKIEFLPLWREIDPAGAEIIQKIGGEMM